MPGIESDKFRVASKATVISCQRLLNFSMSLLVLFVLCDCSEEVGELLVLVVGDGALCAVADDQGAVVLAHPGNRLNCVRTSRT